MFYAEYPSQISRNLTAGSFDLLGEGGAGTPAMTIQINQPTRFMCWATANVMNTDASGDSEVKFWIMTNPNDGSGSTRGMPNIQHTPAGDFAANNRRAIAVQRDYFFDPGGTLASIDFFWAYSVIGGTGKGTAINSQKMSVIASYAPDYAPVGVTNPGAAWTKSAKTLARYRRAETPN
jgi:hypothetical protein